MGRRVRFAIVAALFGIAFPSAVDAGDWPSFRGKHFGHSPEKDLPSSLSKDTILWTVKLPGPGASSPIVADGKIFLTCYSGYGTNTTAGFKPPPGEKPPLPGDKKKFEKKDPFDGPDVGGDQKDLRFQLLCLDAKSGKILWQKEIHPKLPEAKFAGMIRDHGYASSTPVADGEHVYVFFGKTGVLCFDMRGEQIWQQSVGTDMDVWGSASSPVMYKDLVIVNASIESRSLVALDKKTGKEVWRVKGVGRSWSSPILVKVKNGQEELVVNQLGKLVGYDPASGKQLWHCQGIVSNDGGDKFLKAIEPYTVSTPVAGDGIVYLIGGGGPTKSVALAVKAGGAGDVDKTHVVWRKKAGELFGSPVLVGKSLCSVSGILNVLDVTDGRTVMKERLCDNSMDYTSPVVAGGKIYALTRLDGLFVVDSGDKFQTLSRLTFPERDGVFNSTPAVSNGRLYVRSNAYLYCLGKKAAE
jgi:outer membrane protein assembly factor BamB